MNSQQLAHWLIISGLIILFLIYAKPLLIPFILSICIWFLINTLARSLRSIQFRNGYMSEKVSLVAAGMLMIMAVILVIEIISSSVRQMIHGAPAYQERFEELLGVVQGWFNLDSLPKVTEIAQDIDIQSIVLGLVDGVTGLAGDFFLIVLYVLFLLVEQTAIKPKLQALFPEDHAYNKTRAIIDRINNAIRSYISIKTSVSLLTGFVSYLVLVLIGVDFAVFWGFLIFVLNFIPTIGSLVGTLFPTLLAFLQFEQSWKAFLVLALIGGIQIAIGNILEPRWMGNSLNISGLVVILSLSIWGVIWGITGMLLSVPIMVILAIIFAQFEATKPIAIILSENGNIQVTNEGEQ